MKMEIYAIFDSKTKIFSQPSFLINKETALRAFKSACNDPQSNISQSPGDFTLFHLGSYDDESGVFQSAEHHENLGTAIQYKESPVHMAPPIQFQQQEQKAPKRKASRK